MKNTRFRSALAIFALVTLIAPSLATMPAQAQQPRVDREQFVLTQILPDTAVPWRPIYGLNTGEFWIGAFTEAKTLTGQTHGSLWQSFRRWGIPILEIKGCYYDTENSYFEALIDSARGRSNGQWNERIIAAGEYPSACGEHGIESPVIAGHSRQVILFAFDSAQSIDWKSKFLQYKGKTTRNFSQIDRVWDTNYVEQIYNANETPPYNVTAGDTVLRQVVYGYRSDVHTYRYKSAWDTYGDSVQNSSDFERRNDLDQSWEQRKVFVVVTGHLFNAANGGDPNLAGSTALLHIDIVTEIPAGSTYDSNGVQYTQSSSSNRQRVFKTFTVPKDSLKPINPNNPNPYDEYREAAYAIDMKEANGPWNTHNNTHRFDIRVQWVGAEKLALRSITLRDTLAQLQFGHDNASIHYRQAVQEQLRRMIYGPLGYDATRGASRLDKLIRIYTGDEGYYTRNDGYNWLDSVRGQ